MLMFCEIVYPQQENTHSLSRLALGVRGCFSLPHSKHAKLTLALSFLCPPSILLFYPVPYIFRNPFPNTLLSFLSNSLCTGYLRLCFVSLDKILAHISLSSGRVQQSTSTSYYTVITKGKGEVYFPVS